MIAVLLLDGVAYAVKLTLSPILDQVLIRGVLKLGNELLCANARQSRVLIIAASFQSSACLRCLLLAD